MSVCLDALALLAWLQDEPGADITEGLLSQAASSQDFHCFVSAINVGEVYYRLYRMRGADEAETFWEEAWQGLIPLTIITPTPQQLHQAAQLKGRYLIAYGMRLPPSLPRKSSCPWRVAAPLYADGRAPMGGPSPCLVCGAAATAAS